MNQQLIKYYGGKQNIADWIIGFIPEHVTYVEPFCGGATIFFRKEPSKSECINDLNGMVVNLYKQARDNPEELKRVLGLTLCSNEDFKHCRDIYNGKKKASLLEKARATFIVFNLGFAGCSSSFGRRKDSRSLMSCAGKKFDKLFEISKRLRNTCIENENAFNVIRRWDSPDTFFYIDPPYPETDQGPYKHKFTMKDFNRLLLFLSGIQGKFILSFYHKEGMKVNPKWRHETKSTKEHASSNSGRDKNRTESIMMNFDESGKKY